MQTPQQKKNLALAQMELMGASDEEIRAYLYKIDNEDIDESIPDQTQSNNKL